MISLEYHSEYHLISAGQHQASLGGEAPEDSTRMPSRESAFSSPRKRDKWHAAPTLTVEAHCHSSHCSRLVVCKLWDSPENKSPNYTFHCKGKVLALRPSVDVLRDLPSTASVAQPRAASITALWSWAGRRELQQGSRCLAPFQIYQGMNPPFSYSDCWAWFSFQGMSGWWTDQGLFHARTASLLEVKKSPNTLQKGRWTNAYPHLIFYLKYRQSTSEGSTESKVYDKYSMDSLNTNGYAKNTAMPHLMHV